MNLKKARRITAILVAAIIIVLIIGGVIPELFNGILFPVLVVLMIAMGGVVIVYMKCPRCGKAIRPFGQKYCAFCGEEINWEK